MLLLVIFRQLLLVPKPLVYILLITPSPLFISPPPFPSPSFIKLIQNLLRTIYKPRAVSCKVLRIPGLLSRFFYRARLFKARLVLSPGLTLQNL